MGERPYAPTARFEAEAAADAAVVEEATQELARATSVLAQQLEAFLPEGSPLRDAFAAEDWEEVGRLTWSGRVPVEVELAHAVRRVALDHLTSSRSAHAWYAGYLTGPEAPSTSSLGRSIDAALAAARRSRPRMRVFHVVVTRPLAEVATQSPRLAGRLGSAWNEDSFPGPDALHVVSSDGEVLSVGYVPPAGLTRAQEETYRSLRADGLDVTTAAGVARHA